MSKKRKLFTAGQLNDWLATTSQSASVSGHLKSSQTEVEHLDDVMQSEVRILSEFRNKPHKVSRDCEARNPFLPYDPEMYICHLGSGHAVLLNKFNVVPNHYLIVTTEYEEQASALELKEFQALAETQHEFPTLFFYNSGREAGASQPHRHLQALPISEIPLNSTLPELTEDVQSLPELPFSHCIAAVNDQQTPEQWYSTYLAMLQKLNLNNQPDELKPYNFLMTRQWMLVVPRVQGRYENISVNALGFAGLFLVKNREVLDSLRAKGSSEVLKAVSGTS